jgi:nucleotide-binding universal stress UspA family protein
MIRHVLVGFDGSEGSRRAADYARRLAETFGAKITYAFVLEPIPVVSLGFAESFSLAHQQMQAKDLERVHEILDELAKGLPADRVDKRVEYGPAADTICRLARELDVDLVVVGARGLGAVERLLIGSVSSRVVHICERNVLVVH